MDSFNLTQLGILLMAGMGIGGLVYSLIYPILSGEKKTERRVSGFSVESSRSKRSSLKSSANDMQRKRQKVQDTLDELDEKHKAAEKVTLHMRIVRAGLEISNEQFIMYSMVTATVVAVLTYLMAPGNYILAAMGFFVGAFGLPRFYLTKKAAKRQKKFITEFANAIDVIIRGVRSGLPLNDCMTIIASEIPQPVGGEFKSMLEQVRIGVTLENALGRMYERIPVQEVNFFAIVLSIQAKTGGNLAESLSNLSQVLRERRKLVNKVIAFSQEAKASASIIGALPIIVMALVYLTTPDYIMVLFTDPTGHLILAGAGALMTVGVLIMRKMINFDF